MLRADRRPSRPTANPRRPSARGAIACIHLPGGYQSHADQLPPLPYAFNALEPHIDAKTMEIHHDKHHAAYVTNVNKAIENTDWDNGRSKNCCAISTRFPRTSAAPCAINGGGHANHSLFWTTIGPGKGGHPSGKLAEAITSQLGGFDAFKTAFSAAAAGRFGSGWAWLSVDKNKKLVVESTANQDSPYRRQHTGAGHRRVGTRLLFEVSKPPARLHRRVLQRDRLAGRRQTVRSRGSLNNAVRQIGRSRRAGGVWRRQLAQENVCPNSCF